MKAIRFEVGKHVEPGTEKRPGKPEWPNMLTMHLTRKRALQIIGELAAQCEHEDDGEPVRLDLEGELRRWNEESLSWLA